MNKERKCMVDDMRIFFERNRSISFRSARRCQPLGIWEMTKSQRDIRSIFWVLINKA